MAETRAELIAEAQEMGQPHIPEIIQFHADDEQATAYVSYHHGCVPAFLQTPDVTAAYLDVTVPEMPAMVGYSQDSRRIRAEGATRRPNTLYVSQFCLEMSGVTFQKDGRPRRGRLDLSHSQRQQQLARIVTTAFEPHITLRVLPRTADQPTTHSLMRMTMPDGEQRYYQDRVGVFPVTGSAEIDRIEADLDLLDTHAFDHDASVKYVQAVIRRNSENNVIDRRRSRRSQG